MLRKTLSYSVCVRVCVRACMYTNAGTLVCMYMEIGGQLVGLGSVLPPCGSRYRTQLGSDSKCPYPLNHLTGPTFHSCVEVTKESFTLEQPGTPDSMGLKEDGPPCALGSFGRPPVRLQAERGAEAFERIDSSS